MMETEGELTLCKTCTNLASLYLYGSDYTSLVKKPRSEFRLVKLLTFHTLAQCICHPCVSVVRKEVVLLFAVHS
jgi:hypothetical protein